MKTPSAECVGSRGRAFATLSPPLEVQLYRLVSPADAKAMRERKIWSWWRLSIGADETWHSFLKTE